MSAAAVPRCPQLSVEHPTGALDALMEVDDGTSPPRIRRAAFLRTARKLFEGAL